MATTSATKKAQRPRKALRGWNPTVKELEDIEKEYATAFEALRKHNLE